MKVNVNNIFSIRYSYLLPAFNELKRLRRFTVSWVVGSTYI